MIFYTFLVIVIVNISVHQLLHHGTEYISFLGLLLIISQNLTCRLIADFQVLLMYLISDEEISVLCVLALLAPQAPTILCYQNSGMII